jgi:hypothetical protein
VLANPVLILVVSNLGLLFTVNTGLPALKIGMESVTGSLAGGISVFAAAYAAIGINGGNSEHSVTRVGEALLAASPWPAAGHAAHASTCKFCAIASPTLLVHCLPPACLFACAGCHGAAFRRRAATAGHCVTLSLAAACGAGRHLF